MFSLGPLLLPLMPALVSAAPAVKTVVGEWILHGMERPCEADLSECYYSWTISAGPTFDSDPSFCSFNIRAPDDNTPATQVGFTNYYCEDTYQASLGVSPDGFIVVTMINNGSGQDSFFGFTNDELANGATAPDKESPAYVMGTFEGQVRSTRPDADASDEDADHDTPSAAAPAPRWALRNVQRNIDESTNSVSFSCDIDQGNGVTSHCDIHVEAPAGTDVRSYSWFDQKCSDNGWRMSWGYEAETDSAVPTLVNPEGTRASWFGWDKVNENAELPDCGPNPTYPL